MVPETTVPEQVALNILSKFNSDAMARPLQLALLQWLLVVFDHFDSRKRLHSLYGVLFVWLDYEMLVSCRPRSIHLSARCPWQSAHKHINGQRRFSFWTHIFPHAIAYGLPSPVACLAHPI